MIAKEYFTQCYKDDIYQTVKYLDSNFLVDLDYFHKLTDGFPLSIDGYIDFSIKESNSNIRFFYVFYEDKEQEWIRNNIERITERVAPWAKDRVKALGDIFGKDCKIAFGGNITNPYFKLYIVSDKIKENLDKIATIFPFYVDKNLDYTSLNMIGFNIFQDSAAIKLYLIFEHPSLNKIQTYYKGNLPLWALKDLSTLESFVTILPNDDYRAVIVLPTLSNPKVRNRFLKDEKFKLIFNNDKIYPSWIGFNSKGLVDIVYFKPKRDYLLVGEEKDVSFKDSDYKDYQNAQRD